MMKSAQFRKSSPRGPTKYLLSEESPLPKQRTTRTPKYGNILSGSWANRSTQPRLGTFLSVTRFHSLRNCSLSSGEYGNLLLNFSSRKSPSAFMLMSSSEALVEIVSA